ncbi:hypothetical protein [Dyella sp. RRB7]|uniref:hypothetical protein n=1 Tax=Dyella sp. RRB7 TaxID=2919502 RepID=UPI001FA94AC8|nr:hypothetical protein [Dyella sp. RRB7]
MDTKLLLEAVERTGFPLEHHTASLFKKDGWSIFSNKYYLDDTSGQPREIDLIAYKANIVGDVTIYSAIIVSCKKSSRSLFAFLTRGQNKNDPNKDLFPFQYWTNDKAIEHIVSAEVFPKKLSQELAKRAGDVWGAPEREIFGLQELAPITASGKPGDPVSSYKADNDRAFFSSISTLIKAQSYELARLPERQSGAHLYVFELLTVLEGDMVEVDYDKASPSVTATDKQKYIAHYIVNRNEQFTRINFVNRSRLPNMVPQYSRAHDTLVAKLTRERDAFYENIVTDRRRAAVFIETFRERVKNILNYYSPGLVGRSLEASDIDLDWDKKHSVALVQIYFDYSDDGASVIEKLNLENRLGSHIEAVFKSIYKYEGEFRFEEAPPF